MTTDTSTFTYISTWGDLSILDIPVYPYYYPLLSGLL